MKHTLAAAVLVMISSMAFAANWVYLGEGVYNRSQQAFAYYVDTFSIERQGNLRGVWVKHDLHNTPYYHLIQYSISCAHGTLFRRSLSSMTAVESWLVIVAICTRRIFHLKTPQTICGLSSVPIMPPRRLGITLRIRGHIQGTLFPVHRKWFLERNSGGSG